ncbi:PAS domain-containing protein [Methylobacterium ajmalii]|uniref:Blue-light-activated histidine kinase n=1 Tax=Methylobacterium ajmalii TaxID=2738439 RepID=A0ABU9ZZB1_9HYPH
MTVDLMLASPHPMCLLWGPQRALLYNDGYASVLGEQYPTALGKPAREIWPERWDELIPMIDRIFRGENFVLRDQPLPKICNGLEELAWYDFALSPVRNEYGEVVGLLNIASRSAAKQDGDMVAKWAGSSDARLAALVEATSDSLYSTSADWQEMHFLQGCGFIANADAPSVRWMDAYLLPEDQNEVRVKIEAAVASAQLFEMEHRVRLADGSVAWMFSRAVPIRDREGHVTEWFGMAANVTARYRAFAQLRESEAFMRGVLAASKDCIMVLDLDANLTFMSEGGKRAMEVSDFDAINGYPWLSFWKGDGRLVAREAIAAAQAGTTFSFQGYANTITGNQRYWDVQVSPIFGTDRKPEYILSIYRDISRLKVAEDARTVLIQELAHRMKNALTMVQAIVSQTLHQAKSLDEGRTAVSQRLSALGRAQDVLTHSDFTKAGIHDVLAVTLDPYRSVKDRISWSGPRIILPSQQALGLSLAIYELATNATKYGALSNEVGRVSMVWQVQNSSFSFEWVESGGPRVVIPKGRGFGSRLIERIVASYFGGEGRLEFNRSGIRFILSGFVGVNNVNV